MSISGGSVHLGPLLADIQLKAGHPGLIPQRHLVHMHIGSLAHPLAEDGRALRGRDAPGHAGVGS